MSSSTSPRGIVSVPVRVMIAKTSNKDRECVEVVQYNGEIEKDSIRNGERTIDIEKDGNAWVFGCRESRHGGIVVYFCQTVCLLCILSDLESSRLLASPLMTRKTGRGF